MSCPNTAPRRLPPLSRTSPATLVREHRIPTGPPDNPIRQTGSPAPRRASRARSPSCGTNCRDATAAPPSQLGPFPGSATYLETWAASARTRTVSHVTRSGPWIRRPVATPGPSRSMARPATPRTPGSGRPHGSPAASGAARPRRLPTTEPATPRPRGIGPTRRHVRPSPRRGGRQLSRQLTGAPTRIS